MATRPNGLGVAWGGRSWAGSVFTTVVCVLTGQLPSRCKGWGGVYAFYSSLPRARGREVTWVACLPHICGQSAAEQVSVPG